MGSLFGDDERGRKCLEALRKMVDEDLKVMREVMFKEALKRQKERDMAKKKGCKKGGSKKGGKK